MNKNNIQIWDDIYPCEFFEDDINNKRLYVMADDEEIISAFALCDNNAGEAYVEWSEKSAKAMYIDRLGVNVEYSKKGIGQQMLNKAKEISKSIEDAKTLAEVEDIYRPYKPKKKTRATVAKAKGLEPLANIIMEQKETKTIEEINRSKAHKPAPNHPWRNYKKN